MNRRALFKLLLAAPVAAVAAFKLAQTAKPPPLWGMEITTRTFNSTTGEWTEYKTHFVCEANKELAWAS